MTLKELEMILNIPALSDEDLFSIIKRELEIEDQNPNPPTEEELNEWEQQSILLGEKRPKIMDALRKWTAEQRGDCCQTFTDARGAQYSVYENPPFELSDEDWKRYLERLNDPNRDD